MSRRVRNQSTWKNHFAILTYLKKKHVSSGSDLKERIFHETDHDIHAQDQLFDCSAASGIGSEQIASFPVSASTPEDVFSSAHSSTFTSMISEITRFYAGLLESYCTHLLRRF